MITREGIKEDSGDKNRAKERKEERKIGEEINTEKISEGGR